MKAIILLCFFSLAGFATSCQPNNSSTEYDVKIDRSIAVPLVLSEISGLVLKDEYIIAHNDGDDGPNIYILNRSNGKIHKKVKLKNSKNRDWEDIAFDGENIYIGDIGNNNKPRKNFQIYVVSIDAILQADKALNPAYIIDFEYENGKSPNCEAITLYDDKIYLFTKEKNETRVYTLNKKDAWQTAKNNGQLKLKGEITGASANENNKFFMLTGYKKISEKVYYPFLLKVVPNEKKAKNWENQVLSFPKSGQMEGIINLSDNRYLLSTERSGFKASQIYEVSVQ